MTVWQAYETSLRLYFRNLPALLLAAAVAIVPASAAFLILQSATIPTALTEVAARPFFARGPMAPDVTIPSDELASYLAATGMGLALILVAYVFSTAACCVVVAEAWYGRSVTWSHAWRVIRRRLGRLLWLAVIGGLLLTVGFLLCVLPGIWLTIAWAVALPALLFEDHRGTKALERSFRLTRRRWWQTLGAILLITATGWILGAIFTVPSMFATFFVSDYFIASALSGTLGMIASMITTPLTAAVITVFFFDLRARKALEALPSVPAPPGPPEMGTPA